MAKSKQQKEAILKRLENAFKSASSAVFVHFTGISVADESQMRSALKEEGNIYFVAKKTLIKKALQNAGIAGEIPNLDGEVAVVYSAADVEDITGSARGVYTFSKQFGADRLSIIGGIFEGGLKNAVAMNEVATIPPIPVLRGMFVNVINSPIQGLVIALNQIAEKKA